MLPRFFAWPQGNLSEFIAHLQTAATALVTLSSTLGQLNVYKVVAAEQPVPVYQALPKPVRHATVSALAEGDDPGGEIHAVSIWLSKNGHLCFRSSLLGMQLIYKDPALEALCLKPLGTRRRGARPSVI